MSRPPSPPSAAPRASGPRRPWLGVGLAVAALVVGAATGTILFVLPIVAVIVLVRWSRVAGRTTARRILAATEFQMAPALEALGFGSDQDGFGPRPPEEAVVEVVPAGTRTVRQRFVPRADLRPLEIATAEVAGGIGGLRCRGVVTVAHELLDPADEAAAATLVQASTLIAGSEVPETARFACSHGWVVSSFDPLKARDPGVVAGALVGTLARIVDDAAGSRRDGPGR